MICSKCNKTELAVVKDYYFCPSCKIYIGQVATYRPPPKKIAQEPITKELVAFSNSIVRQSILKILIPIISIIVIFFLVNNFYYFDITEGCSIFIFPSTTNIKSALKIIKRISPDNYQNICERVSVVNTDVAFTDYFTPGVFDPNKPRTINILTATPRKITWLAEILAHEACHSRQMYEKRAFSEDECHQIGLKVMQEATVY